MKLHLGCGSITPPGWINIDASWNARLAKVPRIKRLLRSVGVLSRAQFEAVWSPGIFIHDLRKPLPFPDKSVSAIYSPHFLTELHFEEAKRLLKECHRVLQPGGVLRLVVSDLRAYVLEYMGQRQLRDMPKGIISMLPADRLNVRLVLRNSSAASSFFYRLYLGMTGFHSNKWLYDAESLAAHLSSTGFSEVQEMQFHQSRIEGIEQLELESRVLGGEGFCMEGIKPPSHNPAA